MKKYLLILLCGCGCFIAAAEKNYFVNGDFVKLNGKKLPDGWVCDAPGAAVVQDGKNNVLKIKSVFKHGIHSLSIRHTVRNLPAGMYKLSGKLKGPLAEFYTVTTFPAHIQKGGGFARATALPGKDGWLDFHVNIAVPAGCSWVGFVLQPISREENAEFAFASVKLERQKIAADVLEAASGYKNTPVDTKLPKQKDFFLPANVYAVPGVECNIYWKNILLTLDHADYDFDADCAVGRNDQFRWRYIPSARDGGKKFPMTITVRDEDGIVAQGSTTIHVAPADAGKGRTVSLLMVGDSLTDGTVYPAQVSERFKNDKHAALMMFGSGKVKNYPDTAHEGFGGWAWTSFLAKTQDSNKPGKTHYRFSEASKFMVLKDGNFTFDLAAFLKKYGNGKVPDFITFQLGTNDLFSANGKNREYRIAAMIANMDFLLAKIREQAPDAVIGVGLLSLGPTSQDAYGIHYKCTQTNWNLQLSLFRANQAVTAHFAKKKDPKLFLIPHQLNFDRDHQFPSKMEPVNHGNRRTVERKINTHPSDEGYRQFGDTLYAWLKYQLSLK